MTSPGLLRPPVWSESSSQVVQPAWVQASQTIGGFCGLTPTPDTLQSSLSSTAQDGTAAVRPIRSTSPITGRGLKARNPGGGLEDPSRRRVIVVSTALPWLDCSDWVA